MSLGENLAFIISAPRSGSTLLQRMLAESNEICTGLESWIMLHPIYAARESGIQTEYHHSVATDALKHFVEYFGINGHGYNDAIRNYAGTLYGQALANRGGKLFLDKTPAYTRVLGELIEIFPEAKYVVLVRNPLSLLNSAINTWLEGNLQDLYWCEYDLLGSLRDIRRHCKHNEKFRYRMVKYETFVESPAEHLADLYQFLGLRGQFPNSVLYEPQPGLNEQHKSNWKGFYGDPKGVPSLRTPDVSYKDNWRGLLNYPQGLHLARSYLEELGPELCNDLGYDFYSLIEQIAEAERRCSKKDFNNLIPWQVAIKPKLERSRKEKLLLEKRVQVIRYGPVRGLVRFMRSNWLDQLKSLIRDG